MKYFDGHNDVLLKLFYLKDKNIVQEFFNGNEQCHIDYPKIKKSNFCGGFFAIFTPNEEPDDEFFSRMKNAKYDFPLPNEISQEYAYSSTISMIHILNNIVEESKGEIILCKKGADIKKAVNENKIGIILHIEGAEAIDNKFVAIDSLYNLGLRSIGIVWSRNNIFGNGVPFSYPSTPDRGEGLTNLGKELVLLCDNKNILLDLSHLNEKGFFDVANLSGKPLIATHSNAHFITQHSRNLTDEQLKIIKQSNGIVGINFATAFLRDDGKMLKETSLDFVLNHFEHMIKFLGEDNISIGSDFDGAIVPDKIGNLAGINKLKEHMEKKGYDKKLIENFFYRNWMNFLEKNLIE